MNTIDYIDRVKARHGWTSDYQLAKKTGFSKGRISSYRTGRTQMDESTCLQIANLLKINPAAVLIDISAERTKCATAAKVLRQTARQLSNAVLTITTCIVVLIAIAHPHQSLADGIKQVSENVYYVKSQIIQILSFLSAQNTPTTFLIIWLISLISCRFSSNLSKYKKMSI